MKRWVWPHRLDAEYHERSRSHGADEEAIWLRGNPPTPEKSPSYSFATMTFAQVLGDCTQASMATLTSLTPSLQ